MFPATTDRVSAHTAAEINRHLRQEAEERIAHCARHPEDIAARLYELDHEWDIERVLEAAASGIFLTGTVLGIARRRRRWLVFPGIVATFLLLHATHGWCPPLPVLRRLGVRTQGEIDAERYALKALRGDFAGVERDEPRTALAAAAGF